jgi:dolichyl-phosphate-mannose--protein O-mannosyl transferase
MASLNIGFSKIPSSSLEVSGNDSFYIDLKGEKNVSEIYFFLKGKINSDIFTGKPENWVEKITISADDYYKWEKIEINRSTSFLKIDIKESYGELLEIAIIEEDRLIENVSLFRENGEKEFLSKLVDEQEMIVLPITYQSETVFDEIYYVRAAESLLSGEESYETTHPPLGNLVIAAGISVFGFNPFGWRIMGVIFATSMIPMIYFLGKEISSSWLGGFVSSILLMFDFMHFTFSRIATIDTFLVFFLLGAQLFFYKYFFDVLKTGWGVSLRSYFVAIFFVAIAFSIKWTAVFSFISQIFYLCLIRFYFTQKKVEKKYNNILSNKTIIYAISGTIVIFGLVYLLSYVPYMQLGYSLKDVYNRQWYMLNYHLGLTATHPFSSPWWSWPLLSRPIWLYVSNLGKGYVSTITLMGNPAVWWIGLVSFMAVTEKAIKEKCPSLVYLVTMFIVQWIPYVFISRVSFLYYFYPNLIILCLCTSNQVSKKWEGGEERWKIIIYLVFLVVLFGLFYPIISGNKIPVWWKDSLRLLPSWVF